MKTQSAILGYGSPGLTEQRTTVCCTVACLIVSSIEKKNPGIFDNPSISQQNLDTFRSSKIIKLVQCSGYNYVCSQLRGKRLFGYE